MVMGEQTAMCQTRAAADVSKAASCLRAGMAALTEQPTTAERTDKGLKRWGCGVTVTHVFEYQYAAPCLKHKETRDSEQRVNKSAETEFKEKSAQRSWILPTFLETFPIISSTLAAF